MSEMAKCVVCGSQSSKTANYETDRVFYECPVCGRFELGLSDLSHGMDYNRLAPYLAHNRFDSQRVIEYRYHTTLDKDTCDQYRQQFDSGNKQRGRPVHMDAELVDTWYPKSFAEKIDKILLYLDLKSKHIGEMVELSREEMLSMLFVDRYEHDTFGNISERDEDSVEREARYILNHLKNCDYIECNPVLLEDSYIQISPEGYARIDVLQKHTANSRNVLVAMKFGDDTRNLREAIRSGITEAGYVAIFIDEVQHNEFITPELLKHIRDSKFVVVDLTNQNNGAYFEEGYAMGLGKPVIQLCQKDTKLHFDIAQKNTIIWATEADIPERLTNRIKATIE